MTVRRVTADCLDSVGALRRLRGSNLLAEQLSGKGRVVVRFIVGADGSVPAVTITSNDFQAPEVGCCVAKGIAQWQFPDPTNGDFVVVEYPFVVRTSK